MYIYCCLLFVQYLPFTVSTMKTKSNSASCNKINRVHLKELSTAIESLFTALDLYCNVAISSNQLFVRVLSALF
jgi:Tetracycline resistance leader peptide